MTNYVCFSLKIFATNISLESTCLFHPIYLLPQLNPTLPPLPYYLHDYQMCRKPTDPPNPIQPDLIRQVELVFKAWWVGLGYKKNFYNGSGWVWVIKLQTHQTRPDPPIFNIYLKYIIYLITFFKLAVGHLYIYIYLNIYYIFVNFLKKPAVEQHFLSSSYILI